jgi:hypothetical protein
MLEIDNSRPPPLEQLAMAHLCMPTGASIDFCRQAAGVPATDEQIAKRLRVAISTVRSWREIGRSSAP